MSEPMSAERLAACKKHAANWAPTYKGNVTAKGLAETCREIDRLRELWMDLAQEHRRVRVAWKEDRQRLSGELGSIQDYVLEQETEIEGHKAARREADKYLDDLAHPIDSFARRRLRDLLKEKP